MVRINRLPQGELLTLKVQIMGRLKNKSVIARVWKGRTKIEHLEEYTDFMKVRAIPDYNTTIGFVKLTFLRRTDKQFAYFNLITFWENLEVIKNFAGNDFEKAKYYEEDKDYLIDFPEKVTHYECLCRIK